MGRGLVCSLVVVGLLAVRLAAGQDPFHAERAAALAQVDWVEQAYEERLGPRGAEWRARIDREEAALRSTLDWFARNSAGDQALRLVVPLAYFWSEEGRVPEARTMLTNVLDLPSAQAQTAVRARGLSEAGRLAFRQGDNAASRLFYGESVEISRKLQDKAATAIALIGLSRCALRDHEYADVRRYAEESAVLRRDLQDRRGEAAAVEMLGAAARMQGQYGRAAELYQFSLGVHRAEGLEANVAGSIFNLGSVRLRQGRLAEATQLFTDSLQKYRALQDEAGIAYNLTGFAAIAVERRQPTRAARLFGAAFIMLDGLGITFDPDDQLEIDHYSARLLTLLSPEAFRTATADGRTLSPERAMALALAP